MKNEKMKQFLSKTWLFLKEFPVYISLAIIIPSLIYTGRYLFLGHHKYTNDLFFNGNRIDTKPEDFEVTNIKPLFKVADASSFGNYQGGTCYKNYYFLCSNNFEVILIYNMESKKLEDIIHTNAVNTDYHCNTIFFGEDFYSSQDKFPILYISMENAPVHATIGYHIFQRGGQYQIEQVQKVTLTWPDESKKLYFPNSYYDYNSGLLYYSGYTLDSYRRTKTINGVKQQNILRYYAFYKPDYRIANVELDMDRAVDTFELPAETATQGGFVSEGILYQTYSFHKKNDSENSPKMRVIDLENHKIIKEYQDLGPLGVYDEYENIAISEDGHLYAHGNFYLRLYEFEWTQIKNKFLQGTF